MREGAASQDALNALAADTGGRALRNQNYFDRWVNKILDETSQYYLLAWRPNNRAETESNFKNIAVRVIDHPEYTVRLPRGFVNNAAAAHIFEAEEFGFIVMAQPMLDEMLGLSRHLVNRLIVSAGLSEPC